MHLKIKVENMLIVHRYQSDFFKIEIFRNAKTLLRGFAMTENWDIGFLKAIKDSLFDVECACRQFLHMEQDTE